MISNTMRVNKIIIHISGTSCAGKSTVAEALVKEIEDIYTVAYDKLKWQLANYHRDKHKALIKNIVRGIFEVVCREGLPILLDAFIETKEDYKHYSKIAKKYNYKFISVKLVVHKDILIKRFHERVRLAKKQKSKISVTDEKLFLENISKKLFYPKNILIFDTSESNLKQIIKKIKRAIN